MKPTLITYKGKTQSLTAWGKEYGISSSSLNRRIKAGWEIGRALTTPTIDNTILYTYNDKQYSAYELAAMHGNIDVSSMRARLKTMSVEEAVTMPNRHPNRRTRITEEQQKMMFKPKRKEPDKTQCKKCMYADSNFDCCYSLVTGRCRKFISPPSPHCTVYEKGKSVVRQAALKRMGKVRGYE